MPVDLDDHDTGGPSLLFADDLRGTVLRLRETSVYDAEEVRDREGGEMPKFGNWLPVETDRGEQWAVAVGELVEELQRFQDPTTVWIEVTRIEKSGPEQTDPYEVNVETVQDTGQSRL